MKKLIVALLIITVLGSCEWTYRKRWNGNYIKRHNESIKESFALIDSVYKAGAYTATSGNTEHECELKDVNSPKLKRLMAKQKATAYFAGNYEYGHINNLKETMELYYIKREHRRALMVFNEYVFYVPDDGLRKKLLGYFQEYRIDYSFGYGNYLYHYGAYSLLF